MAMAEISLHRTSRRIYNGSLLKKTYEIVKKASFRCAMMMGPSLARPQVTNDQERTSVLLRGGYDAGWSGPCAGNDTCTITVTGSTRITAAFYPLSYLDTVQKLYIGYYQRPADPGGLVFWVNGLSTIDANHDGNFIGEDVTWVLEQFAYSAEARALYGGDITGTNIATVVDSIYEGLFGRQAEADGKAFWVNSFNTGASTPATILWELMKGAQGTDAQTVQNRLVGATRYTHVVDPNLDGEPPFDRRYAGYDDCAAARVWLSGVTWNPSTIPTEGEIRALLPMP
jgi:hypothetical protein